MLRNTCVRLYELPIEYPVTFSFVDMPTEKWVIDVSQSLGENVLENGAQMVVRDAEDSERIMTVIDPRSEVIISVDFAGGALWLGGICVAQQDQLEPYDRGVADILEPSDLFDLISEYLP